MTAQTANEYYQAILDRDARYEDRFYYGVKTTGVFCRPTCASRTPLRRNVEFFTTPQAAHRASYRACKRCKPDEARVALDERFVRVCRAIEAAEEAPALGELAAIAGMSPFHLQRRFKAAVGVSPRQYAEMVKHRRLRDTLKSGDSVTNAIYDAGFGSPSQAYTAARSRLGMTPSQYREGGKHASIVYAVVASPLGRVLLAATERGICRVDIDENDAVLERRLRSEFPKAQIAREDDSLESSASLIVDYLSGTGPWPLLPLDVRATAFQTRVWEALLAIAPGSTVTYTELAQAIGEPRAARAVAQACASNPAALLIPCHRIVPRAGGVGGYRWDAERKRRLLELERAGN
ncbi:MAG TPA: bifunctional DNA-binding transcriptional regulator/O6-methylguanine-DNA methyltransferase Ada [Candidatus Baltobacteraceae bacterium]|jgi:AraC family transcriptional regulator of adaptative response/methylated-DNA-[protein]-cysteine methyltransferase|nr:bifunctional DNA-binding transcriptional regulator/O6-methylguanine-DNA methyltransferase Ada [Candidatus Baltobacteraceae bacterium]